MFAKWIKKLRLEDWRITAEVLSEEDFVERNDHSSDALAFVLTHVETKQATIVIKDPSVWGKSYSLESVIIHELLHVMMATLLAAPTVALEEQVVYTLTTHLST